MKFFFFVLCALPFLTASGGQRQPDLSSHISVVRVPNGGIQPQAIMDSAGTIHLLYYSGERMSGDLFYATSTDLGVTWTRPLQVNSQAGTAIARGSIRGGQMAIGQDGRVHVVWNGSAKAESGQHEAPMLYSHLNSARTAFEPERNLMTHTFGLDGGGSIASDSTGNVYVVWHGSATGAAAGEAGGQVWMAKSEDNGKTFSAEEPAWKNALGACGCCGMAMFADGNGRLMALYRSATENVHRDVYLLSSADYGRHFEGRKVQTWEINACPMSSMSFSETGGKVAGAWETAGQVYFEDFAMKSAEPVGAPGEGRGRKHPRIAVAANGSTLMSWIEGAGYTTGGSLAWQLYDANGKAVGETQRIAGSPAFSFGAVVAKPDGFVVVY